MRGSGLLGTPLDGEGGRMSGEMKWDGERYAAKVQRSQETKMKVIVREVRNEVIQNISTKGPPPSDPGNPPHTLTGHLRRSIATDVDVEDGEVVGYVGTNVKYARRLELPTELNRSYLLYSWNRIKDDIARIAKGKIE